MQNGRQISELIQQLRQLDKQWERYIPGRIGDASEEIKSLINHLMSLLRVELKREPEKAVSEYLQAENIQPETAEQMIKRVSNSLQFYFCFSALRRLEEKDRTALQGLLAAVYEKYIVRFERGYLNQIKPEECDREEWNEIADRMDYLTDFYVSRSYTRKGIAADLMYESGLQEETCEYWADLIDKNYLLLKLNYITQELEELKDGES